MLGPLRCRALLTACLGMLWAVRLILRLLGSIGRIWLSILGIRPEILLSLKEAKSPLVLMWSKICSLVHSVWSYIVQRLYNSNSPVLFNPYTLVTQKGL